jgi:hypothetical protein
MGSGERVQLINKEKKLRKIKIEKGGVKGGYKTVPLNHPLETVEKPTFERLMENVHPAVPSGMRVTRLLASRPGGEVGVFRQPLKKVITGMTLDWPSCF